MSQTKLTVEEVMLRIKEAMKADKLSQKSIEYVHEGILVGNDNNSIQNQLRMLDLEIEKNNLKWNVVTEWLITSHRKTIGRFIVFGKKAVRKILRWYINPLFDQQREFNGSVTRSLNIVNELLHNYAGEVKNLNERLDVLQRENNELLQTHADEIRNLNERLDVLQRENNELLQTHADEIRNLNERLDALQREYEKQTEAELIIANDRLRRIERKLNQGLNLDPNTPTINRLVEEDKANHYDFDYFLFEQRFRGSREDIKERQKVYMPYFVGKSNVLDFGCGRGEFVELLLENGITAQGIDLNPDMVAYCQDRGLPVIQADGLEYLKLQDDNSLGGLFAAQVIEHLTTTEMIQMIRIAFNKLKSGGCLILETVNLQTLLIFANQFYMDPSHNKPVHPETLKFILQSEGFKEIQFIFSSPVKERFVPPLQIESTKSNVQEFNAGINNINNLLFGNQDYAVIAYK
jgi:2-polyprenyl-3-methyl-5-hydroxy-6-metoxy-1,4-benzoquinol methylase